MVAANRYRNQIREKFVYLKLVKVTDLSGKRSLVQNMVQSYYFGKTNKIPWLKSLLCQEVGSRTHLLIKP